jgi:hypothetical protein
VRETRNAKSAPSALDKGPLIDGVPGIGVAELRNGKAFVKQMVKRGLSLNDEYVIDGHRERHVDRSEDAAVAAAIHQALLGQLPA